MTRQSKKRVLLAGGAALVCAIAVLLFHIPGSIPYFDGEDHTYTQVVSPAGGRLPEAGSHHRRPGNCGSHRQLPGRFYLQLPRPVL